MFATFRFFREFLRPRPGTVTVEETTYPRDGGALPATLYRPAATRREALPGWIALHGLTRTGREHPSLVRFARALASSGSVVLVPDMPEWRSLLVAPETTVSTIKTAVLELDRRAGTAPGRIGVIGFSFGATQSLVAATDPVLNGHLAGVAAWGGYADIHRTTRFAFLGAHELDGVEHHLDPDPYGRWILAGNYLHLLPEHGADRALSDALLDLARDVAGRGIRSWSPETDSFKIAAREPLDPSQREMFDLIAPPSGTAYTAGDRRRIEDLVGRMTERAVEQEPLLDPRDHLGRVPVPVFLAHGRGDRLMPWTEMFRLRRALPEDRVVYSGVTSLFGHSFGERRFPTPAVILEAVRFIRMIRRMLRLI
jgi:pimeloyl-ACP methyl ester carboxylesterase